MMVIFHFARNAEETGKELFLVKSQELGEVFYKHKVNILSQEKISNIKGTSQHMWKLPTQRRVLNRKRRRCYRNKGNFATQGKVLNFTGFSKKHAVSTRGEFPLRMSLFAQNIQLCQELSLVLNVSSFIENFSLSLELHFSLKTCPVVNNIPLC